MPIFLSDLQQSLSGLQGGQIPQPQRPKQGFLERFNILPAIGAIGGGILGSFGGPAGLIGGGALGAGLGEGLEQLITRKPNLRGLLFEAALGGAAPAVAGKAAQALGRTGLGLQKFATGVRPGTVGGGLGAAAKEADVLKSLRAFTTPGAAAGKREVLQPTVQALDEQVGRILANKSVPVNQVRPVVERALADFTDDPFLKVKDLVLQQLKDKIVKGRISGQALNTLRREAGKQLAGNTPKAEVNRSLYRALSESISGVSDEAGQLIAQQGNLFAAGVGKAAPLTKAAASSLRIPLVGVNVPGMGAVQAGADIAGRGAQTGAEFLAGIPRPLGIAAAQVGARVPGALAGGEVAPETQFPPETGFGALGGAAIPSPLGTEVTQQQPLLSREQAISLIFANPKLAAAIKTAYEIGLPDDPASKAGSLAAADEFLNKAQQTINTLYQTPTLGYGPLQGRLYDVQIGFAGGAGAPREAVALNQKYNILKLNILRAYQGARISDKDFDLARLYIPNVSDTHETALTKLQILQELLVSAQPQPTAFGTSGIGQPQSGDILNQLTEGF